MDLSGDRLLSFNEFAKGLLEEGIAASVDECRAMFRIFDSDGTGNVDYREVVAACCGGLPDRRRASVLGAFRSLDLAATGAVVLSDLLSAFDARAHPAVRTGARSVQDVQQEFLSMFDVGPRRRMVSFKEFELFYASISPSIDDDKQFDSAVLDTWQLPGELFT
jgi:Ca2+-binding EF-hand superfamily protein